MYGVRAVPIAGALRFEVLSEGRYEPALRRRGRPGRGRPADGPRRGKFRGRKQ